MLLNISSHIKITGSYFILLFILQRRTQSHKSCICLCFELKWNQQKTILTYNNWLIWLVPAINTINFNIHRCSVDVDWNAMFTRHTYFIGDVSKIINHATEFGIRQWFQLLRCPHVLGMLYSNAHGRTMSISTSFQNEDYSEYLFQWANLNEKLYLHNYRREVLLGKTIICILLCGKQV